MAKSSLSHVDSLKAYLSQDSERNEDQALTYFRHVYGENFKRQSDDESCGADGYVPGHFVLELKGSGNDWYAALFQGLAYKNKGLSFSLNIVAAKHFLAIWKVEDIPVEIRNEIFSEKIAPSKIGPKFAKKYSKLKLTILGKAEWNRPEMFDPLFSAKSDMFSATIKSFEKTIEEKKKVRQAVNIKNFVKVLASMKQFFDPKQPIKTVRAFYSMIYAPWDDSSVLSINMRYDDRATLGGIEITNLIPNKRLKFKEFVENHSIQLSDKENIDDFFSKYDEALDIVDEDFRVKNGIYFTDLSLSKFAMWYVKQTVPNLGKDYLVVDPACGSGNLVTNWRSPLELRHKVVSEIEPELLFAVEQRMKGDQWHNGKFTVVPKVAESKGLNFLDKSAGEYLEILQEYLSEKGHKPDKPIAFLCNPPYRSDDDQKASKVSYQINSEIIQQIGNEASSERYLCFLAQMRLICEQAEESGLPSKSLLLLFTQTSWFTKRPVSLPARNYILGGFKERGAFIIDGSEFFDVNGKFPIAFSMWEYAGADANLDVNRPVEVIDLTHLKKSDLANLNWENPAEIDKELALIMKAGKTQHLGIDRPSFSGEWAGTSRKNLYRNLTVAEKDAPAVTHLGLPKGDERHKMKTTYGYAKGTHIGFLLDRTPCRTTVKTDEVNKPWFYLDSRFMKVGTVRLLSGLPDSRGFCAVNEEVSKKLLIWYATAKSFAQCGYPLWANMLEMWEPNIQDKSKYKKLLNYSIAISYADNECMDVVFPANNPVKGAPEIYVSNQMTPMNKESFWMTVVKPLFSDSNEKSTSTALINKMDELFKAWKNHLGGKPSIAISYEKNYFIDSGSLGIGAGLIQIKDYATETNNTKLLELLNSVSSLLKQAKSELHEFINSESGINYFGLTKDMIKNKPVELAPVRQTKFENIYERRKTLAGFIIQELQNDENLGATKLAKILYLADLHYSLELDGKYIKDTAGPVDNRMFYNEKIGLFPNGKSSDIGAVSKSTFTKDGKVFKFSKISTSSATKKFAQNLEKVFNSKANDIKHIVKTLKPLNTDHVEAVATIYACWNDLLIRKKEPSQQTIIKEFFKWSKSKEKFDESDVIKTYKWMIAKKLIPKGKGSVTSNKPPKGPDDVPF